MLYTLALKYPVKWIDKRLYHVTDNENSLSRRTPIQTAAAKLAIGWHEANKAGKYLAFIYNGGRLKFVFNEIDEKMNFLRWTIVVPFYRYKAHLYYSILAWLQSDFMKNVGEIIIVDDASEEDLSDITALHPSRIRLITLPIKKGPAYARNVGLTNAVFEMIFFSDADHIVPPYILSMHTRRHFMTNGEALVVGGVFGRRCFTNVSHEIQTDRKKKLLELHETKGQIFFECANNFAGDKDFDLINEERHDHIWEAVHQLSFTDAWLADWGKIILQYGEGLKDYKFRWTRLSSGSLSMKKNLLLSLGGFDIQLKSMEDWELGIRAQKNNLQIVCAPEAEPYHQIHPVDQDRHKNDRLAIRYLLSQHPKEIDDLLLEKEIILPPAYEFIKKVHKESVEGIDMNEIQSESIWKSNADQPFCILSFDDGPHHYATSLILDTLKRYNAKAIFFLIGIAVENNETLVRRIFEEGHYIGIHHWTHYSTENQTSTEVYELLKRTIDLIKEITGQKPIFARAPYGKFTASYMTACRLLDLEPLGWDLSARDWCQVDAKQIITTLAANGIKNKVMLFHDGTGSPEATNSSLDWLLKVACWNDIKIDLPVSRSLITRKLQPEVYNPFTAMLSL